MDEKGTPMKTAALGALLLCALFPTACESSEPSPATSVEETGTPPYEDPAALVDDLNEHLSKAGVSECAMKDPDLQTSYAARIPNAGAAVCEFDNGAPLYVLIVDNGEATYERHLGRQFGPNHYLWGPTWVLITPNSAPPEALASIREDLGGSE
jgi:hypothetical protein